MNFDEEDRIRENSTKEFMKAFVENHENTKDKIVDINLQLSLLENKAISELLILMRKKKSKKSIFGK